MEKSNEQLQNELDNLKKIVFRIMDFTFPGLDANIKHYDFITNEFVRRQLELDFLKMMQTPASNFNEYCHYSFSQIENLLNYYYTIRFSTKKEELISYFKFGNDPKVKERVSEITYITKWIKFSQEFLKNEKGPTPLNFDIQKIAYVRNSSIHRNTIDINQYEDDIYEKYKAIKRERDKNKEEWDKCNKINSEERNIYYKGNKIEFKKNENFSLVKKRTAEFLKTIQTEIEKHQKEE